MMSFEEKALESLEAGKKLYEEKEYNSCVNRAYYGMFQIILHKIDIINKLDYVDKESKISDMGTHSFTMYWYINNILQNKVKMEDKIMANRCTNTLRDLRHKADYTKEAISENLAKSALRHSNEFYQIVKNR